jgi:hypothetical protein
MITAMLSNHLKISKSNVPEHYLRQEGGGSPDILLPIYQIISTLVTVSGSSVLRAMRLSVQMFTVILSKTYLHHIKLNKGHHQVLKLSSDGNGCASPDLRVRQSTHGVEQNSPIHGRAV